MAFTTNLSGTAQVDDSLILAFDQQFIIAAGQEQVMDQFVSYKQDIGAKSIQFPKYSRLAIDTTPLTETDDPVSEAMVDANILLQPAEYGKVVTKTKLASLQTGGRIDAAAARLVGLHMGQLQDKLALEALDGSANIMTANGGAVNTQAATDVMGRALLNKLYNKLARSSITPLSAEGMFVAVLHEDVIYDIRNEVGSGSWVDVNKYSNAMPILKNEVGSYCGFRIIRDNLATLTADAGAGGTVDVYNSYFLGFNALGKAVSDEPHGVLSGPFDKLARFVNVGWTGVMKYGVVDQDALWLAKSASSVGAN